MMRKKLIEVALPLDAINEASGREKSIRHGHPSTLHLWWARRPLAAARAVIFAQMVDDPASWPELFPTEALQQKERARLFKIIEHLVLWENTTNQVVLQPARDEIWQCWRRTCAENAGHPRAAELFDSNKLPAFHDPFAGGGALPLEAQRLGLESYASDLNPVAVLINKAMIEIPPKFAGRVPVNPAIRGNRMFASSEFPGAQGLAEDVRYYGQWMRDEAEKRIGALYPKVAVTAEMAKERPDLNPYVGQELTVIAWLWARTVKSPNPAFAQVDVPLASTFMLSTKAGKEAYVEPVIENGGYRFTVKVGKPKDAERAKSGTSAGKRAAFRCLMSDTPLPYDYIRDEGQAGRMGARLMAVVAEGARGRVYLAPTAAHEAAALKAKPEWRPDVSLPVNPRDFKTPNYGLMTFADLFTPRQLVALTTFSDLVQEARERVYQDAMESRTSHLGTRASGPHKGWHTRGYLPHIDQPGLIQSLTFRLGDSVPEQLIQQWRTELGLLENSNSEDQNLQNLSKLRDLIDKYDDAGHGECWLKDPRIAQLVETALLHFDAERYQLLEWCIMPNHVHVLIETKHGHPLSDILRSWKTYTAREANLILRRSGAFWMEDYYDRFVRDHRHLDAVRHYIRENPVKARLCRTAEDWRWGSAWSGWGNEDGVEGLKVRNEGRGWDELGELDRRAGGPRTRGDDDHTPLRDGGTGATAYAEAVGVYLAFAVDKMTDRNSSICGWDSSRDSIRGVFGRQAIPMVWDFSESCAIENSAGSFLNAVDQCSRVLTELPAAVCGASRQSDAASQPISSDKLVSTDPPYYDNIGYADLSDFFYVWLRRSLRSTYPDLFATLAVPKAEELVATPYRHGSKEKAETFFLDGMTQAMHRLADQSHPAFPVTIYYAFKQSETTTNEGTASTGWETFIDAVIRAGFGISGTWPMRTELGNRMIGAGTNALASSIVLVCRKRPASAPKATRREFVAALKAELPAALAELQRSNIAPVDLAQAAIGPGMAVYSRYGKVLDNEGRIVTVRDALVLINQVLDETMSEQEGDFDADSRFALAWFEQYGFEEGDFGVANVLAQAKNTGMNGLVEAGILESRLGRVRLLRPTELPADWDPTQDQRRTVWECVHHLIKQLKKGEQEAARLMAKMGAVDAETTRGLAYRLYTICERKKRSQEGLDYNALVQSWIEIQQLSKQARVQGPIQTELFNS